MNREKEKEGRGACCIEWMMLVLITHLWRFFYCVLYNTMAFPSPVPFTPAGALSSCQTAPFTHGIEYLTLELFVDLSSTTTTR